MKKQEKLKYLNLSRCSKITDETPLYYCQNLVYLNLSYCDMITDELMEKVSENLPKLKHLNLSINIF